VKLPGQLPLFGVQAVHVGRYSRRAGFLVCALCGASMAMVATYADCDWCPGFVEPVPPWALLGGSGTPAGQLPLVAAPLEAEAA
jgi:hypothetical protein